MCPAKNPRVSERTLYEYGRFRVVKYIIVMWYVCASLSVHVRAYAHVCVCVVIFMRVYQ